MKVLSAGHASNQFNPQNYFCQDCRSASLEMSYSFIINAHWHAGNRWCQSESCVPARIPFYFPQRGYRHERTGQKWVVQKDYRFTPRASYSQ
jgi:hypothetical protein